MNNSLSLLEFQFFLETNIFLLLISEMFSLFLLLFEWEIYFVRKRKFAKEDFKTGIQKDVPKQYHMGLGFMVMYHSIIVTSLSFISLASVSFASSATSLLTFGESFFKILFLFWHLENLFSKFFFSSQNLRKEYPFLFSFAKKENLFANFSFSSRNLRKEFQVSLLGIWDFCKKFSFSSRNLRIENPILFLFSKVENLFTNFSFSSQKWGKEFLSSLSLLQIGEKNFKFLFLLSIGLFGLSSMPATDHATTNSLI